ncbi:helix-turn-helix domain-containing protein [Lactobacillus apis]|uniref:helix-turn-helix domain-containing protein n=1 Tax=Lactobacillus apis TaxID=303541 RepID=UPI00242EA903|nr:helix-turn-helix transcriptional regulator [Lactobacillus apis]
MNIGQKIKHHRIKQKLTQEHLAKKLFVSRKTVSSWETGRSTPGISTLVELSSILNISTDELLKKDIRIESKGKTLSIINYVEVIIYFILIVSTILTYLKLVGIHVFNHFAIACTLLLSVIHLCVFNDWQRFTIKKKLARLLISFPSIFIINSANLVLNRYLLTMFSNNSPIENMASAIALLFLLLTATFSLVILINFFPKTVFMLVNRCIIYIKTNYFP